MTEGRRITLPRDEAAIERERRHWWQPGQYSRFFYEMTHSDVAEDRYWQLRRATKRTSLEEDNEG